MEFHNIRNMMSSSVNYSIFQINNLNKDTKEMLVGNMSSKMVIDSNIERMLTTEKINIVLKALTKRTQLKKDIVSEIKNMKLVSVISAIKKEGNNSYRAISKHFDELEQLASKNFDIEYSDKYLMIMIQSLLKTMTEEQIITIITNVKNIMEMIGGFEKTNEEQDEEKMDIQVGNGISTFLTSNNFDAKEESINYINKINMTDLNKIMEQCEVCDYDCVDFFGKLFMPYANNLSGDKTQYITGNIFCQFLSECNMTEYLSAQLSEFLSQSDYMKVIISKNKYAIAREYINMLSEHMDVSEYENFITSTIEKSHTTSSTDEKIEEHSIYINTSGMRKFKKNQLDIMLDISMTAGKTALSNFVTSTLFEDSSIATELEDIDIITYFQLEQLVISGKFIKACRGEKKVLSGKIIRKIIYNVFDNHGKLSVQKKVEEEQVESLSAIEALNIEFDASYLAEKEEKIIDQGISYLKSKRMNLCNFKNLMEEQECDISDIAEEITQLDTEINKYFLGMTKDEAIMENVADLHDYISQVEDEKESDKITGVIQYYSEITKGAADTWKVPFEKIEEKSSKANTINGALDNLINKYAKEFNTEEKKENKEKFTVQQTKMIERQVEKVLKNFDNKYSTDMSINEQRIVSFVKQNMNNLVKPELYKSDIKNKFVMQSLINETVSMFCVIFCLMNGDIELKSVYEDITSIDENVKNMGKKVFVKSMDVQGIFKGKFNGQVYVDFGDKVELIESSDVVMTGSLESKNVIVIKGNHKSVIGTVYREMTDHVLMTKDIYGKTGSLSIASLKSIKVLKSHVKLYKCQYDDSSIVIDSEIAAFIKTKPEDIYPLTKYYYNSNNSTNFNEYFSIMYSTALKMFNKIKKEEIDMFKSCKTLKTQFESSKALMMTYKKNNDKKFISQKKETMATKRDFMNAMKVVKMVGNKKNLYLKNNDIKKGCIEYSTEDNVVSIVDNSSKYINKYTGSSSTDHKTNKMTSITKSQTKITMNKAISIVSDLMTDLLA